MLLRGRLHLPTSQRKVG